eukprot:gene12466-biopygen22977
MGNRGTLDETKKNDRRALDDVERLALPAPPPPPPPRPCALQCTHRPVLRPRSRRQGDVYRLGRRPAGPPRCSQPHPQARRRPSHLHMRILMGGTSSKCMWTGRGLQDATKENGSDMSRQ